MTEPKLQDFFDAPDAPESDVAFRLIVAERLSARDALFGLAIKESLAAFAAIALWVLAPVLTPTLEMMSGNMADAFNILGTIGVLTYLSYRVFRHGLRLPVFR